MSANCVKHGRCVLMYRDNDYHHCGCGCRRCRRRRRYHSHRCHYWRRLRQDTSQVH